MWEVIINGDGAFPTERIKLDGEGIPYIIENINQPLMLNIHNEDPLSSSFGVSY